jgi:hypothetical protein
MTPALAILNAESFSDELLDSGSDAADPLARSESVSEFTAAGICQSRRQRFFLPVKLISWA